jgi:hypothetical protein
MFLMPYLRPVTDTGTPVQIDSFSLMLVLILVAVAFTVWFAVTYFMKRERKEYTAQGRPQPAF